MRKRKLLKSQDLKDIQKMMDKTKKRMGGG